MGVEVFEAQDRWFLKILTKLMNVWILPVLSTRCFHQWGGAKMMLRELNSWMKPVDFVYKLETAKRRYAQGGQKPLVEYLNRWRTWVHAELPFKVNSVIDKFRNFVVNNASRYLTQEQSRLGYTKSQFKEDFSSYLTRVKYIPISCSVHDGTINFKKGISKWLKNFSRNYSF